MTESINEKLNELRNSDEIKKRAYNNAEKLYLLGCCQVPAHAKESWEILIDLPDEDPVEWR